MSAETPEEWRAVVGYEGLYEVSDQGRVRSLDRITPHGHSRKGRMMALGEHNRDGYHTVTLSAGDGKTQWFVQRLVAYSFHGNPPEGKPYALHWDGEPRNNTAGNIRWGSNSDNQQDRIRHGRNAYLNKKECPWGHPYDAANTYIQPSTRQRICKICKKRLNDKHNALRRERR